MSDLINKINPQRRIFGVCKEYGEWVITEGSADNIGIYYDGAVIFNNLSKHDLPPVDLLEIASYMIEKWVDFENEVQKNV